MIMKYIWTVFLFIEFVIAFAGP